jgi:HPt (histidine-containing phosphotransfer) domain-containing protein
MLIFAMAPMDPNDAQTDALKALLPNYLRRRADDVKKIEDALAAGDFAVVATVGHNLRGNGASFGFPGLSAIGEALEKNAIAQDREAVLRDLERLRAELTRIDTTKDF